MTTAPSTARPRPCSSGISATPYRTVAGTPSSPDGESRCAATASLTTDHRGSPMSSAPASAFPGLGHLFFWEEPAQFTKAVTSFLLAPAAKSLNGNDGER